MANQKRDSSHNYVVRFRVRGRASIPVQGSCLLRKDVFHGLLASRKHAAPIRWKMRA